jgi:hypothetical protein
MTSNHDFSNSRAAGAVADSSSTPAIATLLERLLTYQEAADRIGVSVRTICRAVAAGELPYVRSVTSLPASAKTISSHG